MAEVMGEAKRKAKAGIIATQRGLTPTLGFPVNLSQWHVVPDEMAGTERDERLRPLVQWAMSRQGPKALGGTKWHAAVHEAGHALVTAHNGFGIKYLRIDSAGCFNGEEKWTGWTETDVRGVTHTHPFIVASFVIAGLVAERSFVPDYRLASSVDEVARFFDICKQAQDFGLMSATEFAESVVDFLSGMMSDPSCVKEHAALAKLLHERERVEHEEADALLRVTREIGAPFAAEFRKFENAGT